MKIHGHGGENIIKNAEKRLYWQVYFASRAFLQFFKLNDVLLRYSNVDDNTNKLATSTVTVLIEQDRNI